MAVENPFLLNASTLVLGDNADEGDLYAENLAVAECVLRVLDKGIEKLETAMLIPMFFEDQELLKQCMTNAELKECLRYYNAYMRHAEHMQDIGKKQLHIALIEMIDMFCENNRIREVVPQHLKKISPEHMTLINALKQLRAIAEVRIKTTAQAEMFKEKAIHGVYLDNERTVKSLEKLKKVLQDQEVSLKWKLRSKMVQIKNYEDELATKRWENSLKIKQEILKSSHAIREFHQSSLIKQDRLSEDLEKAEANYEKSLRLNLKSEKDVRDEKNKLLLQLLGLIKKYDQNIGDKIQESQDLKKSYDEERKLFNIFLVDFNRVESEYNELNNKKLAIEKAEFDEKLFMVVGTRAAKIIQRWWRAWLRVHLKGYKGPKAAKKGKKKKVE